MNKLLDNIENGQNRNAQTKNGAVTLESTLNANVDLFSQLAAMRSRGDNEVISLFSKAYGEDPLKALKILFWCRDIRGGAGERKVVRTVLKYIAETQTATIRKNLHLIPEYGRWDDLMIFADTSLWEDVVALVETQLKHDIKQEKPSLAAKWLPSINTSSTDTVALAKKLQKGLDWTPKRYRKTLSSLRKRINIVETAMCQNDWGEIEFDKVPSRAAMVYRKAFKRHDENRYAQYLSDVEEGKAEIKTATLYPYDIVSKILNNYGGVQSFDKTLSLQWNNLPNYVDPFNGIVVCDVSGSMYSSGYYGGNKSNVRPIDVAISLAIYIAERNTGDWKNRFFTFSSNSELVKLQGSNIYEKVENLSQAAWGMSTNIQSTFNKILVVAKDNDLSQDDLPKTVFIVSDMEFNGACSSTNFEAIDRKFQANGYTRPNLVFWNVNAYGGNSPVTFDQNGTALVSGCSPAILKSVLSGEVLTPVDVMNQTIETERYEKVIL